MITWFDVIAIFGAGMAFEMSICALFAKDTEFYDPSTGKFIAAVAVVLFLLGTLSRWGRLL